MLQSSADHYSTQQRLAAAAVLFARRSWSSVEFAALDESWRPALTRTAVLLAATQQAAARDADSYVAAALSEQGLVADAEARVNPAAMSGAASDGRSLSTLLVAPTARVKQAVAAGAGQAQAMSSGLAVLERIVATQVQDAGRAAVSVAMTARPAVGGYARMLNPPSCSRCAVLAGAFYRWNKGFQRHPMCDCRHVPTSEALAGDLTTDPRAYFDSLTPEQQSRIFTNAGAEAIRDGADLGQVVNARRGMSTAGARTTTEGVRARQGGVRLTPEAIYQQANGDRSTAIGLLRRNGYLT